MNLLRNRRVSTVTAARLITSTMAKLAVFIHGMWHGMWVVAAWLDDKVA
jgi:hypothetical protein